MELSHLKLAHSPMRHPQHPLDPIPKSGKRSVHFEELRTAWSTPPMILGGPRVEAIKATDAAIRQLELCLKFDKD
jgi:hypothetical protein